MRIRNVLAALLLTPFGAVNLSAAGTEPWLEATRPTEQRVQLALAAMTLDEKIAMLHGLFALPFMMPPGESLPKDALIAAGYVPGVPRLKIPPLTESDASLGVVNPGGLRPGDVATAFPSSLALAASFDAKLAYQHGKILGEEAHAKGFDVLLGGGVNLARDPRNGRNFEYLGEDPLLAGILDGEAIRGTQDEHVISTIKHFALNANETNRVTLDAHIDQAALRESDLLAFELAIERGAPGSVMCAYNLINGSYACGNDWLLNQVLKRDWHYKGFVMSDWGAVHATSDALAGLDQESGQQLDKEVYLGAKLRDAVLGHKVPQKRIDDMVGRILYAMFSVGVIDHPPEKAGVDYAAHALAALEEERNGIVLLKNAGALLPLGRIKRIAVIGGESQFGVLSGAGSSQATPSNGAVTKIPVGGRGVMGPERVQVYFPSAPFEQLKNAMPAVDFEYDSGNYPAEAAALAAHSDVAVVFVTQHDCEGFDVPNLTLPNGQDQLVAAVAAANPHTVVVLETGNPVSMPWLKDVQAVLAAWYPGQEGGRAIAEVLAGKVNPSGKLPLSFPTDDANTVRPKLPNLGAEPDAKVSVDYSEGSDIGYRWYAAKGLKPQFPFGFGLSYTSFKYSNFKAGGGKSLTLSVDIENTGPRPGAETAQFYLTALPQGAALRLIGFARATLKPGEKQTLSVTVDPRLLGRFVESRRRFEVEGGRYQVAAGPSSAELSQSTVVTLPARNLP